MDFSQLNAAFRALGVVTDASENHGVLCGLLCARGHAAPHEWLAVMRGEPLARPYPSGVADGPATGTGTPVARVYRETLQQLQDASLIVQIVLPDDEQSLSVRVAALAGWCRGFVYGLGAGGIEDFSALPDDVREITRDIIEISRAATETDEGETDETAYAELVEYLRAGVTLVFEELEVERGTPGGDKVIH